ncbi:MAG: gliding motility-associated protein GldE [Saprospiraceae bacterium]
MESEPDQRQLAVFFPILLFFSSTVSSVEVGIVLILILLLLLGSALISSSEVAFFSLTPNDLEKLEQENSKLGNKIIKLNNRPRYLLATILISNNFINIAIVILSDFVIRQLLPPELIAGWAEQILQIFSIEKYTTIDSIGRALEVMITVVGVTFLLVLFGEVAPKVYAKLNNVKLARFMASPLTVLMKILTPFSAVLVSWTNAIEKRLAQNASVASREDIDEAIELTVNQEKGGEQETGILKSIVKFGDVSVKQIMRPRVDVIALDFQATYREVLKNIRISGYSRMPVYENDFDNIIGILYIKDLIGHLREKADFEWQKLIRSNVLYVPESKKINDLMRQIQLERTHMAIVVDEYGGSAGIVTLEDIMEEVIGEIKDEFDDKPEVVYRKIDDNNYLFEGKTLLQDACRIVEIDTSTFDEIRGESDSIAGLILEVKGIIPKIETEIDYQNYKFKVVAVTKRRIEKVLLTLNTDE